MVRLARASNRIGFLSFRRYCARLVLRGSALEGSGYALSMTVPSRWLQPSPPLAVDDVGFRSAVEMEMEADAAYSQGAPCNAPDLPGLRAGPSVELASGNALTGTEQ